MGLLDRACNQDAVYWAKSSGTDMHGHPNVAAPVAIRVRWDDVSKEFLATDSTKQLSLAEVMVRVDMSPGDFIKLGTLASLTAPNDPRASGAHEIRKFEKIPNRKATDFVRTAYL